MKRAVAGVQAAGMQVGRVEIEPSGKIIILSEKSGSFAEVNPWDVALGKA